MACLSEEVLKILGDNGKQDLYEKLEKFHAAILNERVDFIEYGKPDELSDMRVEGIRNFTTAKRLTLNHSSRQKSL